MTDIPAALVAAAERSAIERTLQTAQIVEGAVVEESEGLLLVKIGAELPPINSAYVTQVPEDPIAVYELLYPSSVLDSPSGTLYLGFLDGRPVATAVRFTTATIAGIGGVGTASEVRRRGIGTAITWRAALDGRAEGCLASYLLSTPMGYRMYQQMGYRHVLNHIRWDAPGSDVGG